MTEEVKVDDLNGKVEDEVRIEPPLSLTGEKEKTYDRECEICGQRFTGKWSAAQLVKHKITKHGFSKEEARESTKKRAARERARKERIPAGKIFEGIWSILPQIVVQFSVPAARAMAWSTPAAGYALDELIAGTFIDQKLLQPILQIESRTSSMIKVVTLPALLVVYEKQPHMRDMLRPYIEQAILNVALLNLKAEQEARAKSEEIRREFEKLGIEIDIDQIAQAFFADIDHAATAAS